MIKKFLVFIIVVLFIENGVCYSQPQGDLVKNACFDQETGNIRYELTVPAWVRIRIGVKDGPLYRNICDWEKRESGKHIETWDGKDLSGTFNLIGRADLMARLNYFTEGDEYLSDVESYDFSQETDNLIGKSVIGVKANQMHKNHPREHCHDLEAQARFTSRVPRTKDGFWVVKKQAPVEITIDEKWFQRERFSIYIFIDDTFVKGELHGYSPYTWIFDPKGLNKGKHLIIINLGGFNNHYAIASLPVYIK